MKRIVFLTIVFLLLVAFGTIRAVDAVKVNQKSKVLIQQNSYFSKVLQDMTIADDNVSIDCNYNEDGTYVKKGCKKFYKQLLSGVKVKKYCQDSAFEKKCVPVYKNYSTDKKCIGLSKNMIEKLDDAFIMYNGTVMIVANDEKKNRLPMFAIDVNGLAAPNVPGEDLFSFTIVRNSAGAYYLSSDNTKCLAIENNK